jgi:hypothetical protein
MCYLAVFVVFVFITLYKVSYYEPNQRFGVRVASVVMCDLRVCLVQVFHK